MMKSKLQPVQERVASIRTQVAFYEKKENKITGGPTQFMATALEELDNLERFIATSLDAEVINMINNHNQRMNEYIQHSTDTDHAHYLFYQTHYEGRYATPALLLLKEDFGIDLVTNVNLISVEESDAIVDALSEQDVSVKKSTLLTELGITGKEVADLYEHLSILMEEREKARLKTAAECIKVGVLESQLQPGVLPREKLDELLAIPEVEKALTSLEIIHAEFMGEVEENRRLLDEAPAWLLQANLINRALCKKALDRINSNKKEDKFDAFVELRNMIMEDIGSLKSRVNNLPYTYYKVTYKNLPDEL